ncbi:hypothetical protein CBL_11173 [Carabus blaptoides fortunei]
MDTNIDRSYIRVVCELGVKNGTKLFKIKNPLRPRRTVEGRGLGHSEEDTSEDDTNSMAGGSILQRDREKEVVVPPPLPPRYRLRDLILGDYAFNDDGERSVFDSAYVFNVTNKGLEDIRTWIDPVSTSQLVPTITD